MSRINVTDQRPKTAMPDSQPPVKRLPVDPSPSAPVAHWTPGARVRAVFSAQAGVWLTRQAIAVLSGLSSAQANTAIHHEIKHGRVERESPMAHRTIGMTQRYRGVMR